MWRIISIVVTIIVFSGAGYYYLQKQALRDLVFAAVRSGDLEGVEEALDQGASLSSADGAGQTPLHVAAYKGTPEMVDHLIRLGAKINSADSRGATPLHWASINANLDNIYLLIKLGANINARDKSGATPLYWAVTGVATFEVQKYLAALILTNNNANPKIANDAGKTPYDYAVSKKLDSLVVLLGPLMRK